ncbi:hypothetical protein Patl1_05297 [Pistacia atlantica]|uniref:Uncharacterized protein n=1 Tax=Pistacia atlantica TaxID=434234 RepID=A0ACC1BTL7_9ROSI|nr:hypothetical protein Patl1_05297 [Pistacia atlantica]
MKLSHEYIYFDSISMQLLTAITSQPTITVLTQTISMTPESFISK